MPGLMASLRSQREAVGPVDLDVLELPEELREAIDICQGLRAQSQGRQRRLVAKILRGENHEAIRERLERLLEERKERPD